MGRNKVVVGRDGGAAAARGAGDVGFGEHEAIGTVVTVTAAEVVVGSGVRGVVHPAVGRGGVALEGCPALPAVLEVVDKFIPVASAAESDGAAFHGVGDEGDGVLRYGSEGGCIGGALRHREGVGGVGADHGVALLPVGEGVARVRRGSKRAFVAYLIYACAADGAAFDRTGGGTDANLVGVAHHRDSAKPRLVLLAGDHHIKCAAAWDGIGEVHGGHT